MAKEMFERDANGRMGKQIVLPLSRAIEISVKSLKMRFWRSIITVSSIVLAIAFFSSILVNTTIVRALKQGPAREVDALNEQLKALERLSAAHATSLGTSSDSEDLQSQIKQLERKTGVVAADAAREVERMQSLLTEKRMVRDTINLKLQGEGGDDPQAEEQMDKWLGKVPFPATRTVLVERANAAGAPESVLAQLADVPDEGYASAENVLNALQRREAGRSLVGSFFAQLKAKDYWLISLALLVCFVGIVNAMLMSVTERFREIGTMKCLGALDSFIVKLFLLESVFQGAAGTLIGIVLGTLLSLLRAWGLYGGVMFKFLPIGGVLLCMVVAQGVGTLLSVIASVFPARAAARMQPVDALRAEQ